MLPFLRSLSIDRLSFWLGFLGGTLFWLFLSRLGPLLKTAITGLRKRSQAARESLLAGTEVRLANEMLHLAQRQHIASPLFSLEEIALPPRLLAPPPFIEPGAQPPTSDITDIAIPYMPDWPEMAAVYGCRTFTLAEALQKGANLVLMGEPGSGKTVALAHLVIQMLQKDQNLGEVARRFPLLLHAGDLPLPLGETNTPLDIIKVAVSRQVSLLTQSRLPAFLSTAFEGGRILLLLDGLDELAPSGLDGVHHFMDELLKSYPDIQVIAAASPANLADLPSLGFQPLALAAWLPEQRRAFSQRWGELWSKYIAPNAQGVYDGNPPEPALINGWLLNDRTPYSPLEITLKVWAAFAGDARGAAARDALEAYVRRMTLKPAGQLFEGGLSETRLALQRIASNLTLSMRSSAHFTEVESWLSGKNIQPSAEEKLSALAEQESEGLQQHSDPKQETASAVLADGYPPIALHKVLPDLLENRLVVEYSGGRLAMIHPVITGYLTAEMLMSAQTQDQNCEKLIAQLDWSGKRLTLRYYGARNHKLPWLAATLHSLNEDPLQRNLFITARWLPDAPGDAAWRSEIMRHLVALLNNDRLPVALRGRAVTALALSNSAGVDMLFRQMLRAPSAGLRQLGALGAGFLNDPRAGGDLCSLLVDPGSTVQQAACLALASIGDKAALEALASAIMHGDENTRSFATQALANHVEEGHPTLEEAAAHEDLMVRRAAVFGLARVQLPWATSLLEKMQLEDSQWVVQNAAAQILEERARLDDRVPQPRPPLHDTPWLLAYAGEQGIGVIPGKPALALLTQAVIKGNPEQRMAALQGLALIGDESGPVSIFQNYYDDDEAFRELAFSSLWHLAARGIPIPSPSQFGLG